MALGYLSPVGYEKMLREDGPPGSAELKPDIEVRE